MINKISIIVPTKNEEEHIGECLAGILKQNVSKDMCEVIVVDGMSMDNTRNIIDKYKGKLNIRVLIDKEKQRVSGITQKQFHLSFYYLFLHRTLLLKTLIYFHL